MADADDRWGHEDLPELLNTEQAARILNVHRRTVARMCQSGKIRCVRIGSRWRVNRDALLRLVGLS